MIVKDKKPRPKGKKTTKTNQLLGLIASIPLLLIFLTLWGLTEPYILDDEAEIATIPNLPSAWEGQKIAQISDFQIGMWWDNTATVAKSVNKILKEKPAAVLITGDFIYHATPNPQQEIDKAIALIRPLTEANIPTYAVLGNHDYGMKSREIPPKTELAAQLENALKSVGIKVLTNEGISLPLQDRDTDLYLVGIGAHWANNDRPNTALAQLLPNSPRVVMMHNPDSFRAFPPNTAPFAVAGHTHGGQIRLPYLPQWSWLAMAKKDRVVADKWVGKEYGAKGNKLYVNRGIGFSDVPLRINCAPEITFFTLQRS